MPSLAGMTPPRHLWSGDWRRESAEAAEAITRPARPPDVPSESPAPERGSGLAHARGALKSARGALKSARGALKPGLAHARRALKSADPRGVRRAVLIGVASLLSAALAYAAVSA